MSAPKEVLDDQSAPSMVLGCQAKRARHPPARDDTAVRSMGVCSALTDPKSSLNSRRQRSMLARGRAAVLRRAKGAWGVDLKLGAGSVEPARSLTVGIVSSVTDCLEKIVERPLVEDTCCIDRVSPRWTAPGPSHLRRLGSRPALAGPGIRSRLKHCQSATGLWHRTCILPIMLCKPNAYRSAGAQRGSPTGRLKQQHLLNPDQP